MTFTLTAKKDEFVTGAVILIWIYTTAGTMVPVTVTATLADYEKSFGDRWHRTTSSLPNNTVWNNITEIDNGDSISIVVSFTTPFSYKKIKAAFLPPPI